MTLVLVIKVPKGLVLAAESRRNLTKIEGKNGIPMEPIDDANKTLHFKNHNYVGAVVAGNASIFGERTPYDFLPKLDSDPQFQPQRLSVAKFADELSHFFMNRFNEEWKQNKGEEFNDISSPLPNDMKFLVAGFDDDKPDGQVYSRYIPNHQLDKKEEEISGRPSGIIWDGQRQIIQRLYKGYSILYERQLEIQNVNYNLQQNSLDQSGLWKPLQDLSLEEAVDFAIFLMQTTVDAQRFLAARQECGGAIRVCTITKDDGLKHVPLRQIAIR